MYKPIKKLMIKFLRWKKSSFPKFFQYIEKPFIFISSGLLGWAIWSNVIEINSNFSQSLISSFIGTIAAGCLVFYFEEMRERRLARISVNRTLALISVYCNHVLNLRAQIIVPIKSEKDRIEAILDQPRLPTDPIIVIQTRLLLNLIHTNYLDFDSSIDDIGAFGGRFPKALILLQHARSSMASMHSLIRTWNELIVEMKTSEYPDDVKLPIFFGKIPVGGNRDIRLPNTIDNLDLSALDTLFFLRKASDEVYSKSIKFFGSKKGLIRAMTIASHRDFLPKEDHIEGW